MSSSVPPSPSVSGPRPLQLVDGNLQSPAISSCPSPTVSGLSTPPPSASKFNPRRQSSISYYPSDHTPSWELRSPTTAGPSTLKRSTSLNQKAPARLNLKRDRRSLPAQDVVVEEERPPLTLTEKHADLLRFIAQKESKCLELRSQLAVHEAELAQLKRKWERIVSRGMDRAYSQNPIQNGTSSNSLLSGAVKDVSRLLSAGLGDLSASPSPAPSAAKPDVSLRTHVLPLKTNRSYGHANTQSTSSVSTSATSASLNSSVRLSQSSASSLAFDDPPYERDEVNGDGEDEESPETMKRRSIRVDGGTGIESPIEISPSSAIKAAKLHRRKSREVPAPPSPLATSATASPSTPSMEEKQRARSKRSSLQVGAAGLPPAASIPGLGPLASPLASAWMGSVGNSMGKKWEEIQKGDTFTKSQKRASLLFSDAASSLFAALTPSSTSSPSPSSTSVSISSNPFAASLSPLSSSPTPSASPSPLASHASAQSLLEDDDDAPALGSVLLPQHKPLAPTPSPKPSPVPAQTKSLLDDDEEWNW
ncbi:hypothetical protein L226DRAFT_501372 [Lentinus tigrinus ALCF2SS1-7]|uniref:Uncharacterized protein n=1 Tax=Lentinus tigrinus ALCF2SS1-6 TaxID=1328759 RepID=A0A5C2SQN2_9APHY|nr:hypothetical protein L227DRAFT_570940 [Lentinus tigrinus ALCF2SS1-6]RPD78944.1 hypothetical protein L226DRAFT_501372 [Lentinus tigrinus ALCF2SS1-7]